MQELIETFDQTQPSSPVAVSVATPAASVEVSVPEAAAPVYPPTTSYSPEYSAASPPTEVRRLLHASCIPLCSVLNLRWSCRKWALACRPRWCHRASL